MEHKEFTFKSNKNKQIIDITEDISKALKKQEANMGLCHLLIRHTTAAISFSDLDPETNLDMLDILSAIVPELKFRHPKALSRTTDHILSTLIGNSLFIPFKDKKLMLGTWQRIIIFEFDGPRERKVIMSIN